MNPVLQLARLNARVAGLALRGRWLGAGEIAAGYDGVAPTYDRVWQCHLRDATDALLERLMSEFRANANARARSAPDLPVWHLGGAGPLHRRDIYDDVH